MKALWARRDLSFDASAQQSWTEERDAERPKLTGKKSRHVPKSKKITASPFSRNSRMEPGIQAPISQRGIGVSPYSDAQCVEDGLR